MRRLAREQKLNTMLKQNMYLLLPLCAVVVFSCKKEKKNTPVTPTPNPGDPTVVYDDYVRLKPGNYWIYQEYRLDSASDPGQPLGEYDSVYVEKDTMINRKTYHKYHYESLAGTPGHTYFLRDSLSYVVDEAGVIKFSSWDYQSVFRTMVRLPDASSSDTLIITEQMGLANETTTVDAGTFTTSAFRQIYHFPVGYPYGATRSYDYRYAKNVGLVKATSGFYYSSPITFEKRLVRYHVQ